jgi:AcrR family transcriptional regulator
MKKIKIQRPTPRPPQQNRAKQKVELILEAAIRLLDKGGLPMLTTNAVAEIAGVSIGTLYQYFPNKEAILDVLAEREMAELSERVLAAVQALSATSPQDRISGIIRAITASYGARPSVHRVVIDYSLSRGSKRMNPLIDRVITLLASPNGPAASPLTAAEAFVLTNAFAGVMRAMIMRSDATASRQDDIEEALGRLVTTFAQKAPQQTTVIGVQSNMPE